MREHVGLQLRLGAATVAGAHHCGERLASNPVAAALVADHVPPAAGARRLTPLVPSVDDRSGSGDDDDARIVAGAGGQGNQRVVDHQDARAMPDPAHDGRDRIGLVLSIDAGNPETDRRRHHRPAVERTGHDLLQDALDRLFPGRMQVGARSAALRHNITTFVGEQADGLRAARVNPQHVHMRAIMLRSGRRIGQAGQVPPCLPHLPSSIWSIRPDHR